MVTLGASTRFNTFAETARLAQMRQTLSRDDDPADERKKEP